jgi:hypothetical protein
LAAARPKLPPGVWFAGRVFASPRVGRFAAKGFRSLFICDYQSLVTGLVPLLAIRCGVGTAAHGFSSAPGPGRRQAGGNGFSRFPTIIEFSL